MSEFRPTVEWEREDIARMLDCLSVIEEPGFVMAEWLPLENPTPGSPFNNFRKYHPVMQEMWTLCYESSCWIRPYDPLPEDETPEAIQFSVLGTSFQDSYFETATLNQIRRYFVLCTRGERYCDGHIHGEWSGGAFLAAYRRLRVLYEAGA